MDIPGQDAELHITLEITRKATGLTETVHLVGKVKSIEESEPDNEQDKPDS